MPNGSHLSQWKTPTCSTCNYPLGVRDECFFFPHSAACLHSESNMMWMQHDHKITKCSCSRGEPIHRFSPFTQISGVNYFVSGGHWGPHGPLEVTNKNLKQIKILLNSSEWALSLEKAGITTWRLNLITSSFTKKKKMDLNSEKCKALTWCDVICGSSDFK